MKNPQETMLPKSSFKIITFIVSVNHVTNFGTTKINSKQTITEGPWNPNLTKQKHTTPDLLPTIVIKIQGGWLK